MMELISPRPLAGVQELKQELFLRAEELERLVAIYKHKLCGEEMASLNYDTKKLLEQSSTDVLGEQRGQFYDIYMRKREVKLREEWKARGAQKEAEMRGMMENLASTSSTVMNKGKATESKNDHSRQTNSRKPSSTSWSSATTTHNPTIRSSNSAALRKESTKSSTGIRKETILESSVARSQSSNDRMCLVKDIKARRSQPLRKNSVSLGEPRDFMHLNFDPDTLTSPTMHINLPRSGAPKPLLRKSNGTGPTAKLRISITEENQLKESTEMLKEGNSAYRRFGSNGQIVKSSKSRNSHMQNFLSPVHKASDFDSSVDSPHNVNQYLEGKTVRARKKWGGVERPFAAVDASTHAIMDVTKGIKKFLNFGNRNRSIEIHNDKEDDHDSENYSFENSRNSSIGQIPSFSSFNEDEKRHEQVNRPHNPSHSGNLKEREKHLLANSPKQRILSSLPPFHFRQNENKSR